MAKRKRTEPRRELAALRVQAGYSQAKFADVVGASLNTVRSWEQGWSAPMPRYRPSIARALRVSLIELDRLIEGRDPEVNHHPVPEWLTHYESLVQAAGELAEIEFYLIPALLQTRDYAASVQRRDWQQLDDDQTEARVAKRLSRQAVLDRSDHPLELTTLLPESTLREAAAGPEVMNDQLEHLVQLAERPNIDIQTIPADGRANSAVGGFQLLTRPNGTVPFMASTVDVGGVRYHEDPDVITKFVDRFAFLTSVALSPGDSIAHIKEIQGSYQ
jgi:DNA-binding XRE family transcriptional regulator